MGSGRSRTCRAVAHGCAFPRDGRLFSPLWMRAIALADHHVSSLAVDPTHALPLAEQPPADLRHLQEARADDTPNLSHRACCPSASSPDAAVLIMLIEAVLKPGVSRKPLGWLAIAGAAAAGLAAGISFVSASSPPSAAAYRSIPSASFSTCLSPLSSS